jgi:hypothetical protein
MNVQNNDTTGGDTSGNTQAPTTPAPEPAAPPTEADRMEKAYAILDAADKPPVPEADQAPAPNPEPDPVRGDDSTAQREGGPAPEADGDGLEQAEVAATGLPSLKELRASLAQRNGEPEPPAPPVEEKSAEQEKVEQVLDAIPLSELQQDPVSALIAHGVNPREFLRSMTAHVLGKRQEVKQEQGKAAPETLTKEQAEELVQQQLEAFQRQQQQQQAQMQAEMARQRSEEQFLGIVSDKSAFPWISRLDPDDLLPKAHRLADMYVAAGHRNFSIQDIAKALEQDYNERFSDAAKAGSNQAEDRAAGAGTNGTDVSTTLSQSLPAQPSSEGRPMTMEERVAAAERIVARMED